MAKKEEYKEKNLQFMSEMAGQDGVSELPCGVLYKEIEKGTGTVSPELNSVVSVHYRGMLINGREFDSSWKRGCPEAFRLNQVIEGGRSASTDACRRSLDDLYPLYVGIWYTYIGPDSRFFHLNI